MALVVLQHFWMVMEEEASGMHCSVLEPGLVVKLKKDKNMPENVKLGRFFHSIQQNTCRMLFSVHFNIHKKFRAEWHYPSKRGEVSLLRILFLSPPVTHMVLDTVNSLLMHTSPKTDTQNWSLPFYIPLSWLSIRRIQYVIQSTFV